MVFVCARKSISFSSQLKFDALQGMLIVDNHFPPPLKPLKGIGYCLVFVCVPDKEGVRISIEGGGSRYETFFFFFLIYEYKN